MLGAAALQQRCSSASRAPRLLTRAPHPAPLLSSQVNTAVKALDLRANKLDQAAKDAVTAAWNGRSDGLILEV